MGEQTSEHSPFVIVEFLEGSNNDKSFLDVVPRSWLTADSKECWFPKSASTKKSRKWASQQKYPDEKTWKKYPLNRVISEAKNWEQGLRRLKTALDAASGTDIESEREPPQISILNMEELSKTLATRSPLPNLGETILLNNMLDFHMTNEISREDVVLWEDNSTNDTSQNVTIVQGSSDEGNLKGLLEASLKEMETRMCQKMESNKRSILHDFNKKINEVKTMLVTPAAEHYENTDEVNAIAGLGTSLPVKTVEEFLVFNESLASSPEKRDLLKKVIIFSIGGSFNFRTALNRAMTAIITKNVQVQYSGCGRKTKNQPAKPPFIKTIVFICMRDVFLSRFKNDVPNLQVFVSHISRWLAGAADRDGGRALRVSVPNADTGVEKVTIQLEPHQQQQ